MLKFSDSQFGMREKLVESKNKRMRNFWEYH